MMGGGGGPFCCDTWVDAAVVGGGGFHFVVIHDSDAVDTGTSLCWFGVCLKTMRAT